eukprot:7339393-Alexandrium_andersonii.AAC.1
MLLHFRRGPCGDIGGGSKDGDPEFGPGSSGDPKHGDPDHGSSSGAGSSGDPNDCLLYTSPSPRD